MAKWLLSLWLAVLLVDVSIFVFVIYLHEKNLIF